MGAVLIATLASYGAPFPPVLIILSIFGGPNEPQPLIASMLFILAWFVVLAPATAGYFAAKMARHQPLLHGLVTGIVCGIAMTFLVLMTPHIDRPQLHPSAIKYIGSFLLQTCCGLFGGWLWRYRNRSVIEL
jgi:hypothetical protein